MNLFQVEFILDEMSIQNYCAHVYKHDANFGKKFGVHC